MSLKTHVLIGAIVNFLSLLTLASSVRAEETYRETNAHEELVTVVGTKTERSIDQIGAAVSVIDRESIERQMSRDIADIVRYEPGISVAGTGSRFGLTGFNIRGIEGNRVLTIVDGIRVADEFSFGPFLSSRRDFVDVDSLEVVEIARGPISSLYGSDALGGVVSMTTRTPKSYLSSGDNFAANLKAGYSGDDNSKVGAINLALGDETIASSISYTRRDSEETETSGRSGGVAQSREEADPQDAEVDNISFKFSYSPAENHDFLLVVEEFLSEVEQEIQSDYGLLLIGRGPPTLIASRDAFDEKERSRISLSYEFNGSGWINTILARAYAQESNTAQITREIRVPGLGAGPLDRVRSSEFEQNIDGVYVHLSSDFVVAESANTLTYGAEIFETSSISIRNGSTSNAEGVAQIERTSFPTRDFPITDVRQAALFVQNESVSFNDRLRVTLGARFDDFEAKALGDPVYYSGNPGSPVPANFEDSETTLSASVVYRLHQNLSSYFRYSEGFRAPPYDDVNVGFTNPIGGYKTISNPNLKSETSEGLEMGIRWGSESVSANFSVYQNDYENFIESLSIAPSFLRFGGIDPADGYLTFQSVNRSAVEIEGLEVSADVALSALSKGLEGFSVRFASSYAKGTDTVVREPLNTINPLTAVLGMEYVASRWGASLVLTAVKSKNPSDISGDRISTKGYGILDLTGYFDLSDSATLNIGLFNLTDKSYIRWADTVSIGNDAPGRFSQPGFNAGLSLRVSL